MISEAARSRLALGVGLAGGAVADRLFGDPARWHPVAGFGRVAGELERWMWGPRRLRGAAYTGALVGGVVVLTRTVDRRLRRRPIMRGVLAGAVTWCTLGGRSLGHEATRLAEAVRAGDLPGARHVLPSLAGRDPAGLPGDELCRAAIESVAENTADAVVGPLVWAALAGPMGATAYRAANTLDAMVGYRSERHLRFGWASARLDDVLTWPAARIGAGLAVVLAPVALSHGPLAGGRSPLYRSQGVGQMKLRRDRGTGLVQASRHVAPCRMASMAPVRGGRRGLPATARHRCSGLTRRRRSGPRGLLPLLAGALPAVVERQGVRRAAWETLRRYGRAHPSPNAGLMEAAFAGALGVGLGGRNRYGNRVEDRPKIGSGKAPGPDDVDAAVRLAEAIGLAAACLSVLWVLATGAIGRHRAASRGPTSWGAGRW